MGRKRIRFIPKESKKLKYLYFIKVYFKGRDILKFGISNNYVRRFTEYNNSETVGYLKDIFHVYKCNYPKRIETMLKWWMSQYAKPIFKYEYFPLEEYPKIHKKAKQFARLLGMELVKII